MDVSVSGTIDQKTYLKNFREASTPLAPLDPPVTRGSDSETDEERSHAYLQVLVLRP